MEDANPQQSPHCRYQLLSNGIHEFILADGSRAAFDEFVTVLAQVEAQDESDMLTYLLDMQAGIPPITYAFNQVKKYLDGLDDRRNVRLAIVHDPASSIETLQSFIQLLQIKGTFQFFTDRQQAMAWLLDVTT